MRKYTDQQFTEAVQNSFSIRSVLNILGLADAGGSYKTFYSTVKRLNLKTNHFTGQAHLKGKINEFHFKQPLKEILIINSTYTSSYHLKQRLVKEGYLDNKCSCCTLFEWLGQPLSLHLDHIDGVNTNNMISNLRLLCPNCHSQTPTYCGRNKRK